jgi:hypothetical protein
MHQNLSKNANLNPNFIIKTTPQKPYYLFYRYETFSELVQSFVSISGIGGCRGSCASAGGSGCVAVIGRVIRVPLKRGASGLSNGGGIVAWRWVLMALWMEIGFFLPDLGLRFCYCRGLTCHMPFNIDAATAMLVPE